MINFKDSNLEQLNAVQNGDGPCLVLAGAGSGKTRTIIYRLAYLLERGAEPKNICLVTFTNKAAKEMTMRTETLFGEQPKGLVAGTFHHLANFLLRRYGKRIGLRPNFTILDEDDKKSLIKAAISDAGVDTRQRRFPAASVLNGIFCFAKNSGGTIESALEIKNPKFLEIKDEIIDVCRHFEKKKRDGNMADFDDLLSLTLNLLETQNDIREALSRNFRYILVDEYQDTNPIQAAILYHLASYHRNIMVVGDDSQSIYSFRAADIKNILNFPKAYSDVKIFKLEVNYRSTPDILDLANNIITNNHAQFEKKLRSIRSSGGTKPYIFSARDREEEARFIADKILELRDEGVEMKEMAVLFRASYHSEVLEMELTRRDIPYDYRGGVRFFERAHIKDVIAFLRAFYNLKDEAAWMRILSFGVGIGPATTKKFFEVICTRENPRDVLNINGALFGNKARLAWEEVLSVWRKFVNLAPAESEKFLKNEIVVGAEIDAEKNTLPPALGARPNVFIDEILSSYYSDYIENKYENASERLQDIYEMANYSSRYEDLGTFLSEITLYEDIGAERAKAGEQNQDDEKIILSTIHQAKGLEWNTVFVINLTDGAFPNRRAFLEDSALEEERRLFYVAATRAKDNLFLTYPLTGGDGGFGSASGGMFFSEPSRFLRELDGKLLERGKMEDDDDLPVIDINAEEFVGKLPKKSYLPDVDIDIEF